VIVKQREESRRRGTGQHCQAFGNCSENHLKQDQKALFFENIIFLSTSCAIVDQVAMQVFRRREEKLGRESTYVSTETY
jgi:hypothetical protein